MTYMDMDTITSVTGAQELNRDRVLLSLRSLNINSNLSRGHVTQYTTTGGSWGEKGRCGAALKRKPQECLLVKKQWLNNTIYLLSIRAIYFLRRSIIQSTTTKLNTTIMSKFLSLAMVITRVPGRGGGKLSVSVGSPKMHGATSASLRANGFGIVLLSGDSGIIRERVSSAL